MTGILPILDGELGAGAGEDLLCGKAMWVGAGVRGE